MDGASRRKLRFAFLKELDKGYVLNEKDLGLSYIEYMYFLRELRDDYYIQGVTITKLDIDTSRARPTEKGEIYLEENSALAKSYKVVKEIRDWVRL